jgi:hypothetical protein
MLATLRKKDVSYTTHIIALGVKINVCIQISSFFSKRFLKDGNSKIEMRGNQSNSWYRWMDKGMYNFLDTFFKKKMNEHFRH